MPQMPVGNLRPPYAILSRVRTHLATQMPLLRQQAEKDNMRPHSPGRATNWTFGFWSHHRRSIGRIKARRRWRSAADESKRRCVHSVSVAPSSDHGHAIWRRKPGPANRPAPSRLDARRCLRMGYRQAVAKWRLYNNTISVPNSF
jgi:hypothetical protein